MGGREAAVAAISAAAILLAGHEAELTALAARRFGATPEEALLRPVAEAALALARRYKAQLEVAAAFVEEARAEAGVDAERAPS